MWHFATKCTAVKIAKPWMSSHFSETRDSSYIGSDMYPECPTKVWWGMSCWLNQWESGPKVIQGPGGVTTWPCMVPSWCGASRTIRDCCWPWGILSPPRTAALLPSPEEKWAWKWMNDKLDKKQVSKPNRCTWLISWHHCSHNFHHCTIRSLSTSSHRSLSYLT